MKILIEDKIVKIIYDEKVDRWIATSEEIEGLVVEAGSFNKVLHLAKENAKILIKENISGKNMP